MTRRVIPVLLAAALLVGATTPVSTAQVSPDVIEHVIARTVLLATLVRAGSQYAVIGQCSGSFVSPDGYILTAAHCVRATEDYPKVNIRQGQLFTPEGLLAVSVNLPDQARPVLMMIAKRVGDNPELDLALLKVDALIGSGTTQPLPRDFRVPVIAIGNAETVRHGEPIAVVGFPGVGGETVTANQGTVAGFLADPQGRKTIMKIDVWSGQGASGGPVVNARGEEVAVASHSMFRAQVVERSVRATMTSRLPQEWVQYLRGEPSAGRPPAAGPGPSTPPVSQTRLVVVLQGRVVDAVTGAGIAGAGVFVLKPGVSPRTAGADDVLSSAIADGNGLFETRPAVSRGATYPVVILASGYQGVAGNLELAPDGPDVMSVGTILLQRQ
jgi:hypothetical protein